MPEIDRMSDRPPYLQIADQLRAAITTGEFDATVASVQATAHRAPLPLT